MPELSDTDMIVFLGDFNYRLYDISYDVAMSLVSRRCFDWLRKNDQLQVEMSSGRVFQGLREAHFKFPPTYKFEKHKAGLSGIVTLMIRHICLCLPLQECFLRYHFGSNELIIFLNS
jgi:hypothetical protein